MFFMNQENIQEYASNHVYIYGIILWLVAFIHYIILNLINTGGKFIKS